MAGIAIPLDAEAVTRRGANLVSVYDRCTRPADLRWVLRRGRERLLHDSHREFVRSGRPAAIV